MLQIVIWDYLICPYGVGFNGNGFENFDFDVIRYVEFFMILTIFVVISNIYGHMWLNLHVSLTFSFEKISCL